MAEEPFYVAAYDAGGQNVRVVVAKSDGTIISGKRRNIEDIVGADLPRVVGDLLEEALSDAKIKESRDVNIVSFASSQAGTIDRENGIILFSPNVKKCRNIRIGEYIEKQFQIPFWAENDADAAAYGTLKKDPQAADMKHILYIVMGAGVGGGIIIDGEIYSGIGAAGEVGHMIIQPNGRNCGCGKKGCWEAYSSGTGIARTAREYEQLRGPNIRKAANLGDEDELKAEHVFKAYKAGCDDAKEIIDKVGNYNTSAVSNLINVLRPEAVFIGESVAVNNPIILQMLHERVEKSLMPGVKETKIYLTEVENPGLHGAIHLAIDRYKKMQKG